MAKTTTEMGDDGRIVTYKNSRSRQKSAAREIPWTKGPTTRRAKVARALWG
jgi:hypothetical protein